MRDLAPILPADLSSLKNQSLLGFLAAVAVVQENPGQLLRTASGFDVLELQVATALAARLGLIETHPFGDVTLTPTGLAWAAAQISGLRPLLRLADAEGVA